MKSHQFELLCYSEEDGKLGTFEPLYIPGFQINRIFLSPIFRKVRTELTMLV